MKNEKSLKIILEKLFEMKFYSPIWVAEMRIKFIHICKYMFICILQRNTWI